MTSGVMQDSMTPSTSGERPRFRPYASTKHQVTKGRYITSNDHRGYIPVYEYPLNGQWIMMDIDDGYILWTGIWKALGNSKADIVKMVDSQPDLAPLIRRVRGGYLKIQGTWMPYEVALRLSRRVAWPIREDLVPLFGPTFPSTCLSPDQPGYGQIVATGTGRRRARRSNATVSTSSTVSRGSQPNWTVVTPVPESGAVQGHARDLLLANLSPSPTLHAMQVDAQSHAYQSGSGPALPGPGASWPAPGAVQRDRTPRLRYSPYPGPASSSSQHRKASTSSSSLGSSYDVFPPVPARDYVLDHRHAGADAHAITLPPIKALGRYKDEHMGQFALPPISAFEDVRGVDSRDSAAVLRRLQLDDEGAFKREHMAFDAPRRLSSSPPSRHILVQGDSSVHAWQYVRPVSHSFQGDVSRRDSVRMQQRHQRTPELSVSVPSSSHDGTSTSDASPISPATPRSTEPPPQSFSERAGTAPFSAFKERGHAPAPTSDLYLNLPPLADRAWSGDYSVSARKEASGLGRGESHLIACRRSCGDGATSDSEVPVSRPMRPW